MKRKDFLRNSLLATPAFLLNKALIAQINSVKTPEPFVVEAGKSRFGEVVKYRGVHPNDLKISSRDTQGQLSVFEYTGLSKVGPSFHLHYEQDEIFTILDGKYRFVCGDQTYTLGPGETIFLPRSVAHSWIQLTDKGKLVYMLQPAGKMEEFFTKMNNLKAPLSESEYEAIHEAHGMKVVGPPLTL